VDPSSVFVFIDNVDVYTFSKMPLETKSRLFYEPQALEDSFQLKIPKFLKENGQLVMPPDSKILLTGFWSRLDFKGSQMPTCRENSTMVITGEQ